MKNVERFNKVLNFDKSAGRTPIIEWAMWWHLTIERWYEEGLPKDISANDFFGHDKLKQVWFPIRSHGFPSPKSHGAGVVWDYDSYKEAKKFMYSEQLLIDTCKDIKSYVAENPDDTFWYSLEGFFWFPRTLFGIEDHLYAFYDHEELMLEMNQDLTNYHKKTIEMLYEIVTPSYMTYAEDMSYNHGTMISKEQYDKFMAPFYAQLNPIIKETGTKILIDTDGFVEPLIPWFVESGINGILPLERMAGVDVNRIRANNPDLIMIGGFDKTVMHKGEEAMRAEFERIKPAIQSGGYIPSVDHQTPPDVSIDNYKIFMKLLNEYSIYE